MTPAERAVLRRIASDMRGQAVHLSATPRPTPDSLGAAQAWESAANRIDSFLDATNLGGSDADA